MRVAAMSWRSAWSRSSPSSACSSSWISSAENARVAAADVDDLALAAQPLDRERHLGPRRDDDVQAGRGEADQRFDEPDRAVGPGEDVQVVEDQHEVTLERRLQGIGDRRRGGRCLGHDRRVVGRLDRALDLLREVGRDRRQLHPQGGGNARGQRADRPVRCVERVPGRRPNGRDAGGKRRLPEAGAADDDRQPPLRALEEALVEERPGQRAGGIGRGQELRLAAARAARERHRGLRAGPRRRSWSVEL